MKRHYAPRTAALLLALAACGETPEQPGPPVLRLFDLLEQVQLVATTEAERPAAARVSRLVRPRDREFFARVALDHPNGDADERLALLTPAGTTLRFELELPRQTTLRLGLGAVGAGEAADEETRTISGRAVLRLVASENESVLLDRELSDPYWSEVEIQIEATGKVTLELVTRGAADSWVAWSSPELSGSPRPGWDLVFISLDTLRADHLGCYGHYRPTSPNLDALAEDAFRFETVLSSAPWTLPSHESIFSGLYPLSHGELRQVPLAAVLWQAGYRTEARTGGGVMDFRMGSLARGFDSYRLHDWIRDLDGLVGSLEASNDRRRFLFLHTYEPHDPYVDARFATDLPGGRVDRYFDKGLYHPIQDTITEEEKAYVEALYDGDIAYTDEQLGELLTRLENAGALERAIVVVTSDHGEQFWEHGSWRHGQNLYDEQLRVPLLLRLPEALRRELGLQRGHGVIEQQVRLVDLYPTLLELLGLPLDRPVQGRSLVPLLRGEELEEAAALAEYPNVPELESKALRFRGFKLLRTFSTRLGDPPEAEELYDLRRDPTERTNLIESRSEVARELAAVLERLVGSGWTGEGQALETSELDPDLRRALEALGYIGNQN